MEDSISALLTSKLNPLSFGQRDRNKEFKLSAFVSQNIHKSSITLFITENHIMTITYLGRM